MTTGSLVIDRSPVSKYTKSWNGTDYPVLAPSNLFQTVWKKYERDVEAGSIQLPYHYRKTWAQRREKLRTTRVDHPYSMQFLFWSDSEASWGVKDFYPPYGIIRVDTFYFRASYGSEGYSSNFATAWSANDTISLQGKLREKIVGSDFDMGVFLGEGREALNMITSTANRLYNAYRGLRRFDVKLISRSLGITPDEASRALKKGKAASANPAVRASQAWLELQYGWIPLVGDAYGAAQALAQQLNEPAVQTYRVRMKKPIICTPSSSTIQTYKFDALVRAQLIARVKEVNVAALNGLVDPSSVLWELTPWSFVADWFIPIGNYLSARGLAQSVSGTFVTSIFKKVKYEVTGAIPQSLTVPYKEFNFNHLKLDLQRTVSTSLSTPKPQFKPLNEVLSWKRAANAVSLLILQGKSGLNKAWATRGG